MKRKSSKAKPKRFPGVGSSRIVSRLLDDIPTNWLDPLLTGPTAALKGNGGTWGCRDIERLLLALFERMRKTANDQAEAQPPANPKM